MSLWIGAQICSRRIFSHVELIKNFSSWYAIVYSNLLQITGLQLEEETRFFKNIFKTVMNRELPFTLDRENIVSMIQHSI